MFLRSAGLTVLILFGGLLVGLAAGNLLFKVLPGSSVVHPAPLHMVIAALPALAGFLAAGAFWGIQMGKLARSNNRRRMAWAGMLGFAPVTILLALGLGIAEPYLVANMRLSIHRVFTVLFVPSAFLIAGVSAWAVGWGLNDAALARSLFWRVGLSAAGAFLVVNLLMEAFGWVVGAPGAAERATMVVVMGLGNLAAAFVAGGLMGQMLSGAFQPEPS